MSTEEISNCTRKHFDGPHACPECGFQLVKTGATVTFDRYGAMQVIPEKTPLFGCRRFHGEDHVVCNACGYNGEVRLVFACAKWKRNKTAR